MNDNLLCSIFAAKIELTEQHEQKQQDNMQGKQISGYTLQRLLGTGGMAEVWYAENKIGKKAAVKILLPKLCQDENVVSRFRTEAKVMVDLDHPNIRQVYDYGDIDGRPAIVMEYLNGDDLKARMKRGQRFTDEELKRWWNQLVDALNYTHHKGIVHRDIKPGNIFVDREGNIKLLDFGIAKVRESISSTQTGQKLGTLMYMSPEQVKDSKHIDYKTDVYSLAVTFVHLITGRKPYNSDTTSDFEISEQIVYKPLDLSGLPVVWKGFLAPYLAKEPNQRPSLATFRTAPVDELAKTGVSDDEGTVVGDAPSKPTPKNRETPSDPASEPSKQPQNRKGLWIGVGVVAAVAILLLLLLKPKREEPVTIDPDTEAYDACSTVAEYREYLRDYGRNALHYNEAKAFVDQYVADSTAKVQQEAEAALAKAEAEQKAEVEALAQDEAEAKEEAAYKKCTTIAGCNNYLKTYPQGKYVEQVKQKKAELEDEEKNNSIDFTIVRYGRMPDSEPDFTYFFKKDSDKTKNKSSEVLGQFLIDLKRNVPRVHVECEEGKWAKWVITITLVGYSTPDESSEVAEKRVRAVQSNILKSMKELKLSGPVVFNYVTLGIDYLDFISAIRSSNFAEREQVLNMIQGSSDISQTIDFLMAAYPQLEEIMSSLRCVKVFGDADFECR